VKTVPQENAPAEKEERSAGGFILWFVVGVMLYILSIGPVGRLMFEGKISLSTVEKIYAPLTWLCETRIGQVVGKPFFEWYGELWGWGSPQTKRP
jgi:hypothetical protein